MLHEVTVLHEIAIEYFKLNHITMDVKVIDILCSSDVYRNKNMMEVSFKFLKGLISNTNKYINLCKKDGGYLFRLNLDGNEILIQVDVKLQH